MSKKELTKQEMLNALSLNDTMMIKNLDKKYIEVMYNKFNNKKK